MKRDPSAAPTLGSGTGTITALNGSVTISHGLASKPTSIVVTPADNCTAPLEVPAATVTDSDFVVKFMEGVVLDVDATFRWVAV